MLDLVLCQLNWKIDEWTHSTWKSGDRQEKKQIRLRITHRKFIHFRDNHFRAVMNINYANYNVPEHRLSLHRSRSNFEKTFAPIRSLWCAWFMLLPPTPSPATCKLIWLFLSPRKNAFFIISRHLDVCWRLREKRKSILLCNFQSRQQFPVHPALLI